MIKIFRFARYIFSDDRALFMLIQKMTGFFARDLKIYQTAFTHKSASIKLDSGKCINNERLEYLGDAILDAIVADYLFEKFPEKKEGSLTKLRSRIVSREQLNNIALQLGLDNMIVSHIQPRETKNIYGNALEAFIGAAYLDLGYNRTYKFIVEKLIKRYIDINALESINTDYKSQIIEWAQKTKQDIVFENEEDEELPPNNQIFTSYVIVNSKVVGTGTGSSKKEAQQNASQEALKKTKDFPEE